jgi:NAD(P)-dependent dehydrogenase (short-subunit alcohol dehydrogenase family)
MNRIEGKHAIVSGGTRGIGFSIAAGLLDQGAAVLICGTGQSGVDAAVARLKSRAGDRAAGTVCDVRNYSQVRSMMASAEAMWGGIDILINNAGIGAFANVDRMAVETWDAVLATNLSGVFYCCREAIPLLRKKGGGYIINIGSLAGKNAFAGGGAYNASKFGLIGFSEALMQEVRYDHIRVSYVMPGSVNTEFNDRAPDPNTWKLLPEDVAEVVLNLLRMDPRALPSRVELRPSEPKK